MVNLKPAQLTEAMIARVPGELCYIVYGSDTLYSNIRGTRIAVLRHINPKLIQRLIKAGKLEIQPRAFEVGEGLEPEVLRIVVLAGVKQESPRRIADVETAEAMAYRDERGRKLDANQKSHVMSAAEVEEFSASLKRTSAAYTLVLKDLRSKGGALSKVGKVAVEFLTFEQDEIERLIHSLS